MKEFNSDTHCKCPTCGRPHQKATKKVSHRYVKKVWLTEAQMFWTQVKFTADSSKCWEWQGSMSGNRGSFFYKNVRATAPRYSYLEHYGKITEGKIIAQSCKNNLCVNPLHLIPAVNLIDQEKVAFFAERDRKLIALFCENNTLDFVGQKFGITRERVRQILCAAGIMTRHRNRKIQTKFRKKRLTATERFWNNIDKSGGEDACWLWKGIDLDMYGRFRWNKKSHNSHALAYFFHHKKWTVNWTLHTCDTPACCNPKHLYDGTPKQNAQDRERKGRREAAGRLNGEQVKRIRRNHTNGTNIRTIARAEGLSYMRVHGVVRNKSYNGLPRLTQQTLQCLKFLAENSNKCGNDIIAEISVKKSNVYRILKRLKSLEYVTAYHQNGRQIGYSITKKGREVFEKRLENGNGSQN